MEYDWLPSCGASDAMMFFSIPLRRTARVDPSGVQQIRSFASSFDFKNQKGLVERKEAAMAQKKVER